MIHPTAIVDKKAEIASEVEVGPYAFIGPHVKIFKKAIIHHHASVVGYTHLDEGVEIHPFASIGGPPQDLKYNGAESYCKIGTRSVIREYVTINSGTEHGSETRIGSDCLMMAYSHLGHNAIVGDEVIIANAGTLAGHVEVEDKVIIGGLVGIHQFVRIGRMAFIGGCSKIVKDMPPFCLADGNPARVRAINRIGMQRKGYSAETILNVKRAYKLLYHNHLIFSEAKKQLSSLAKECSEVQCMIDFMEKSQRGITSNRQ